MILGGGALGAYSFLTFVLQVRKNPEKTSPRKPVPSGDRTRARCVTSAHATTCSTTVDESVLKQKNICNCKHMKLFQKILIKHIDTGLFYISVSTGVSNTSEFRYSHRNNEGDSGQVTTQAIEQGLPFQSSDQEIQLKWAQNQLPEQQLPMLLFKTHQGYLSECGRILYADVMFALRLVAVNLSNCCKMQNGTLIVSMHCVCAGNCN